MKTDIEISNECNMLNIKEIASKLNISEDYLENYGKYKAKINLDIDNILNKEDGKLILVTSINPTPFGEGKTTVSIGINDSLRNLGKNSLVVLREPSLGPVFGIKGGATGGGYSQVVPMEDINLHFTGDIHAIESANNLLCAIIDNHIFQGNTLGINRVVFNRCIDLNDRALRNITINSRYSRKEQFNITVASEMMAIVCMSENIEDLKYRIGNILIGYTKDNKMIFARDLDCVGAIASLLKDAIKPNLVQTLENNPAIIHGGPFANIAHGCNSIISTKLALKLSDYVVTEAGFGADLGAEKFFDIKCGIANLKPNCVVINATIRSLKYNGGADKNNINVENIEVLKLGVVNLERHIENISKYTKNIVVCLNKFEYDTDLEIEYVKEFVKNMGYPIEVCNSFKEGSNGAIELAKRIIESCEKQNDFNILYNYDDSIINKINKVCKEIYRASNVIINEAIKGKIKLIEENNLDKLPICIAKTQYSFTDDPKKLGAPNNFDMTITDIRLCSGAGFIVVLMGNIMTMPGLGKNSTYLNMDIDNQGNIKGLF
ncbi:MAG: formate--tetrahydrofolate ligase [Firmicutes bacterium]|nr:formate--tetrahydrofolate ligase [Bacillota bacterium]